MTSMTLQRSESPTPRESQLMAANVIFLGTAVFYLLIVGAGREKVQPLVQTDPQTAKRILSLEQTLQRDPRAVDNALELAQLYREAGEFPFSYDALREAERTGTQEPGWRITLALAYLQLGKSDDALRVLEQVERGCRRSACSSDTQVRLDIFGRVARLLKERHIEPNRHGLAAQKALHEVLKPVEVDLARMRPKAPVPPPPAATTPAK